jgi:hypothetical protein
VISGILMPEQKPGDNPPVPTASGMR